MEVILLKLLRDRRRAEKSTRLARVQSTRNDLQAKDGAPDGGFLTWLTANVQGRLSASVEQPLLEFK
jgi:hypothetical protein